MFTVQPLCKTILLTAGAVAMVSVNIPTDNILTAVVSGVFLCWLYFYLSSLKIYLTGNCIVKSRGRFFKQKTTVMLKNISYTETAILFYNFPAILRLHTHNKSIFIIGLNGYQRQTMEKYIQQLK